MAEKPNKLELAMLGDEQILLYCATCDIILFRDDEENQENLEIAKEVGDEHSHYYQHNVNLYRRIWQKF